MTKEVKLFFNDCDVIFILSDQTPLVNIDITKLIQYYKTKINDFRIIKSTNKYIDVITKVLGIEPNSLIESIRSNKYKRKGTIISELMAPIFTSWIGDHYLYLWIVKNLINLKMNYTIYKGDSDISTIPNYNFYNKKDLLINLFYNSDIETVVKYVVLLDRIIDDDNPYEYLTLRYLILSEISNIITSTNINLSNQKTYIMKDSSTNLIKIGKAINPKYREKTLQSEKPTISLFAVCEDNIESELHKKFEDKRVRGEWFNLTDNEINVILKDYKFILK